MRLFGVFALVLTASLSFGAPKSHRVVIELDQDGGTIFAKALSSTGNLLRAFKGEPTQVEIVCRDNGIGLLLIKAGPLADRMRKLHRAGVVFAACRNTMKTRKLAARQLIPFAETVDSGVAELVRKQEAGWAYLKAAD